MKKHVLFMVLLMTLAAAGVRAAEPTALLVVSDHGRYGCIDPAGKIVIEPRFEALGLFHDELAAAKEQGKWGFIDRSGKWVVKLQYDDVNPFTSGYAAVKVADKWGFVDTAGNMLAEPQYAWVSVSSHEGLTGVAVAGDKRKCGFVDKTGKLVIPATFLSVHDFSEGLAAVATGDDPHTEKWGFIDHQGRFVIQPRFDHVYDFHEGLALFSLGGQTLSEQSYLGGKRGYIDKTGKVVIPAKFLSAEDFSDGLAAVSMKPHLDKEVGFIDHHGKLVIHPHYQYLGWQFDEGLVPVVQDGKAGYLDKSGKQVIAGPWRKTYAFDKGGARVLAGSGQQEIFGLIDHSGHYLVPAKYERVEMTTVPGVFHVRQNSKWAYLDKAGRTIWEDK